MIHANPGAAKQNVSFSAQDVQTFAKRLSKDHLQILTAAATDSSYREIARDLKLSIGTVKSRLNRARTIMNDFSRTERDSQCPPRAAPST